MQMLAGEGCAVSILLHAGEARGRQKDGQTQDGCLSKGSLAHWGRKPAFSARQMLLRRLRQVQEVEAVAGLKQTTPCPACLSAAASAVVSCAWSALGGWRRGDVWLSSHTPPARQSLAMPSHGWFWALLLPSHSQSFISSLPVPGQFPGEAAPPTQSRSDPEGRCSWHMLSSPSEVSNSAGTGVVESQGLPYLLLYLLAGIKSTQPTLTCFQPWSRGGTGFFTPSVVFQGRQERLQRGPHWEDDGVPHTHLLLRKNPPRTENASLMPQPCTPRGPPAWQRGFMAFTTSLGN